MADAPARGAAGPIAIFAHPVYPMLLPVPVIAFTAAVITDLAYRNTAQMLWQNFSIWLIAAGLVFGTVAGIVLLIDVLVAGLVRRTASALPHVLLFTAALVVELFNALVHSRDGWTAVVPSGLLLSIVGAAMILVSGWLWQSVRAAANRP